ncbi:MAG: cytochrome c maturation protein CcmE [Bacteroidia bacterium]|nr:cytochrome c maturation protein CcmE [Bacteroidia bacterium]MDW8157898.1 cytochrome c maturation protein CcmE [Bacteroidia bacterium]
MKTLSIIGIIAIAILMAVLMVNFASEVSEYTNFEQARKMQKEVHVVAKWVMKEKAHYDPQKDIFEFYLQDSTNNIARVHYPDPMPANFEKAEKVVVCGRYEGNIFKANKILMKCPSKYNDNASKPASSVTQDL